MSKGIFAGMLSVRANNGTVVLGGHFSEFSVTLIGSSCTASVQSGTKELSTISFSPVQGEEALVAICACYSSERKNSAAKQFKGFIKLHWDGDKLIADLNQFVCSPDRLGQVMDDNNIVVTTNGQKFFCSPPLVHCSHEEKNELASLGFRTGVDTDLACKYLIGQAKFEELEAVASGDLRTVEQVRVAEMLANISRVTESYRQAQESAQAEIRGLSRKYMEECKRVILLENQLNNTIGAKWRRFWKKVFIRR